MELTGYQIESANSVALTFKDGRRELVSVAELSSYVLPEDAKRIQASFELRRRYFNELPKWVQLIVVIILALSLAVATVKAAPGIIHFIHTQPRLVKPTPSTQSAPVSLPSHSASAVKSSTAIPATSSQSSSIQFSSEENRPTSKRASRSLVQSAPSASSTVQQVVGSVPRMIHSAINNLVVPAAQSVAKSVSKL